MIEVTVNLTAGATDKSGVSDPVVAPAGVDRFTCFGRAGTWGTGPAVATLESSPPNQERWVSRGLTFDADEEHRDQECVPGERFRIRNTTAAADADAHAYFSFEFTKAGL